MWAPGYSPPSVSATRKALLKPGESTAPDEFQTSSMCHRVPEPGDENDWLAQVDEEHQSLDVFLRETPWLVSTRPRWVPRGHFNPEERYIAAKYPGLSFHLLLLDSKQVHGVSPLQPDSDLLIDYMRTYLHIPIELLPMAELVTSNNGADCEILFHHLPSPTLKRTRTGDIPSRYHQYPIKSRYHPQSRSRQLAIKSVLQTLKRIRPKNSLGLLMLTSTELFEEPPDLFVAGMAEGNSRVGVFSLTRYDPGLRFSCEHWWKRRRVETGLEEGQNWRCFMARACKLLAHEIGHLLGLGHCTFYQCSMNGSGHLDEDFAQPYHLCMICLRKIVELTGCPVKERYIQLRDIYAQRLGLEEVARRIDTRLKEIANHST